MGALEGRAQAGDEAPVSVGSQARARATRPQTIRPRPHEDPALPLDPDRPTARRRRWRTALGGVSVLSLAALITVAVWVFGIVQPSLSGLDVVSHGS